MERESPNSVGEQLPRLPLRRTDTAAAADPILVGNEAMSATLRLWRHSDRYRELLERTRDGLLALPDHTDGPREPSPADGNRLQREVDGVIARWKAARAEARRAC